jgi:hypothetical protein
MLKVSLGFLVLFCLVPDVARAQVPMVCTQACHGPSLIAQQRLDVAGWTREINKMTGWGADIADSDKDALITFLARTFNNQRPRPASSKTMPEGKGKDVFEVSCLNCHDDKPIAALKADRVGWTRAIDRMLGWGATVPAGRKEDLIEYLLKNFGK